MSNYHHFLECNCPNSSYGKKHTAACYETIISNFQTELAAANAIAAEQRGAHERAAHMVRELKAEHTIANVRIQHLIGVLRRDGYWAALMTDEEVIKQIDQKQAGADHS